MVIDVLDDEILTLVSTDDPILHSKLPEFDFNEPPIDPIKFAKSLAKTMIHNNGLGLAANQVGRPYRAFAMATNPVIVCYNPRIVDISEEKIELEEGCLSYPGLVLKITRPRKIKVRYQYPNGEVVTDIYHDMTARIFQHECLPGRTEILTEDGIKIISEIVNEKYSGKVLSFNNTTGMFEYKQIIGWKKERNLKKKKWVSLYTDSKTNNIICTEDHLVSRMMDILNPHKGVDYVPANFMLNEYICMFPRNDREKNKTYPIFNKDQLSVVIGTTLGDGHISKRGNLTWCHGDTQKEYGEHKAAILNAIDYRCVPKNGYSQTPLHIYTTQVNEQLKLLRDIFYDGNKKTIKRILPYIDDIALSYWFMDDGFLKIKKGKKIDTVYSSLHTEGFSIEDVDLIRKWFWDKHGIKANIISRKGGKSFLRFSKDDTLKFLSIIGPYIHSSMKYKCYGEYETTQLDVTPLHFTCRKVKQIKYTKTESCLFDLSIEDNHNMIANYNVVHNCDHLDGITFDYHVSNLKLAMARKKMQKRMKPRK